MRYLAVSIPVEKNNRNLEIILLRRQVKLPRTDNTKAFVQNFVLYTTDYSYLTQLSFCDNGIIV